LGSTSTQIKSKTLKPLKMLITKQVEVSCFYYIPFSIYAVFLDLNWCQAYA